MAWNLPQQQSNLDLYVYATIVALGTAICLILMTVRACRALWRWWKPTPKTIPTLLESSLASWNSSNLFRVRDLLNGGVLILGGPGSGKTSGSGRLLSGSIIDNPASCGLILAAKPEDAAEFRDLFARAARPNDLIEFGPQHAARFNFLRYVTQVYDGNTREVVQCLLTLAETLRGHESTGGGEDGQFWRQQTERVFYHAVQVVKLAEGTVSAPSLGRFISGAATSPEMVQSDEWQAGEHNRLLESAFDKRTVSQADLFDFEQAVTFWLSEWPRMADRTRSSILASVMGILHILNSGQVRELISGGTTVTPDHLLNGRWLLVNMPPAEYGNAGVLVNAGWKYLFEKRILKRAAAGDDPFAVIWVDEAQQFLNTFDAHFLAQCRSHRGCMVALTQSLHGLFALMKGDAGKQQALATLACFHTRIFHALGSAEDATFAAELVGKRPKMFFGGSVTPAPNVYDSLFGNSNMSSSFSQQMEYIVPPLVFLNGLKRGGPQSDGVVEGIVVKSGEPFSHGQNWLKAVFRQGRGP